MKKQIFKITSFQRMPLWFRRILLNWVFPDYMMLSDENRRMRDGLFNVLSYMPELYPDNPDKVRVENVLYNRDRQPRPMPILPTGDCFYEVYRAN